MGMSIASQVVLDPLLADKFSRVRRQETVSEVNGRSTVNTIQTDNLVGVVTMNRDIETIRQEFPEVQFSTRVINVVTKANLQAAVAGYQPDLVIWRGDNYVVLQVSPYPQYGSGFYEAVATSIDLADQPI
jgi:hypothetical protein